MEIRCKKEDCKHNTGCSCKAGHIMVDNKHHCDSYVKDPIKKELVQENGNIFETPANKIPSNLRNVPLDCKAKNCLYNKQEQCQADGITVIANDEEDEESCADCATFCAR